MRKLLILTLILLFNMSELFSTGVCVVDVGKYQFLQLTETKISCYVENQIAQVNYKETFKNTFGKDVKIKYAFPLPENASSINLQWKIFGQTYIATLRGEPQDSSLPGDNNYRNDIDRYLGTFPVYFEISTPIPKDSTVTFSITYVELLEYEFGNVMVNCPYKYDLFQDDPLENFEFKFLLKAERTVDSILFVNKPDETIYNFSGQYQFNYTSDNFPMDEDVRVDFKLNSSELGLFGLSTFFEHPVDTMGKGYFLFVVEPDPTEDEDVLPKVFTLIVDKSGSMSGQKIVQAKNAAKYIVENMNQGDYFNIVDFDSQVNSFSNQHVAFDSFTKTQALGYIDNIYDGGSTNISGAFEMALNQFQPASDKTNIIMFFTDGEQTAGITDTDKLIAYIKSLNQGKDVTIFSFGIGNSVNEKLLNQIATQNYGICELLKDNELYERLTKFYQKIRNPVLTNSNVSFSPEKVFEVYPKYLPNLYKGQQMIVAGRYAENINDLKVTFSGKRDNESVVYNYNFTLADTFSYQGLVVAKTWAKMKIKKLLSDYYSFNPNSYEAEKIKEEIIELSFDYEILTKFTSYHENGGVTFIPVEMLTEFNGIPKANGIELFWETASEINNFGFYIDRKINEGEWKNITFLPGQGNSKIPHSYEYNDTDVELGHKYYYRLRQVDFDGSLDNEMEYRVIEIDYNIYSSIKFELIGPNPVIDNTKFSLFLPISENVNISIYDLNGNMIVELSNKIFGPGNYEFSWDKMNSIGEQVSSGTYVYSATIGEKQFSGKMIVR